MEPNETVAQFVNKLTVLTNQMKSCGKAVTNSMRVEKVITGLTSKFDNLVVAIEQSKDLDTLKLEQLRGSLEAHELKLKNRDGVKKDEKETEKALFTQTQKKEVVVMNLGRGKVKEIGRVTRMRVEILSKNLRRKKVRVTAKERRNSRNTFNAITVKSGVTLQMNV